MSEKENVFDKLRQALLGLDGEMTEKAAMEVVNKKLNAVEASSVLTETIRVLGDKFGRHEIFLPDLMLATEAMGKGLAVLEPEIKKTKGDIPSRGTVVLATVRGDIHDLGKTIVGTMLTASGFNVIDIGKDVSSYAILDTAKKYKPDIIGLSATMTTTIPMQKETIEYLKALGFRDKYKIMLGGAAVTPAHVEVAGADGYAENAAEAVKLAEKLMKR